MHSKKLVFVLLVVLAVIAVVIRQCNRTGEEKAQSRRAGSTDERASRGLKRDARLLFFSKHAKCRMECRQITQREVAEVLEYGNINYKKSDLQDARGPEYAVEGTTSDRQRVRVIFAQKKTQITVVTVIDLDNEWNCPSCN